MRTTRQMFGQIAATERAKAQDQADRERRAAEAEARLDEPLTRREVLDALETVAQGMLTGHVQETPWGLLQALQEALR